LSTFANVAFPSNAGCARDHTPNSQPSRPTSVVSITAANAAGEDGLRC